MYLSEVLEDQFPGALLGDIVKTIDRDEFEPSAIHFALTKLPFSLVITTNWDKLLEKAYSRMGKVVRARTWSEPLDVLRDIRHHDFSVFYLHGSIDKHGTIIRTRNHYQFLLHQNTTLQTCLRTLLLTRTLLFVGHSLRDPDLLSLLNEIARGYKEKSGPGQPHYHYALLPDTELNNLAHRRLQEDYNVLAFPYPLQNGAGHEDQVVMFLESLSDASSRMSVPDLMNPLRETEGDWLQSVETDASGLFSRDRILESLIRQAVRQTGSFRGDICLIEENVLKWPRISSGPTDIKNPISVQPNSVIGTAFDAKPEQSQMSRRQQLDQFYLHLPDVKNMRPHRRKYPKLKYVSCHPSVVCELACKINVDGETIGVLNLEADRTNAYSDEHIITARTFARKISAVCSAARDRNLRGTRLTRFEDSPQQLTSFLHQHQSLRAIDGIVYLADFNSGTLRGQHCGGSGQIDFSFENQKSFAVRVLRDEIAGSLSDAQKAVHDGEADGEGVGRFRIKGRVYGMPVNIFGVHAGVFVAWSKRGLLNSSHEDLINCMVQVVVNDDSPEFLYSRSVLKRMRRIEAAENAHAGMHEVLLAVQKFGWERARLWTLRGRHFECEASAGKREARDAHAGKRNEISKNVYCQLICNRYLTDPHARIQKPSMYGPDPMAQAIGKDPDGDWVIAPIVGKSGRTHRLVGYISADNHTRADKAIEMNSANFLALRALDAITVAYSRRR